MDSDYYSLSQNTNSIAPHKGEAGTIVRIRMKNFMCHDNLEVTLNPRINFICGKNGSGKSAIQTAIAVGLGGKALATNRGTSLKALIKNDKNSCSLIIDICNQGPLAYHPQKYGDVIQVERSFSHSSQGYKIKDARGKVVSTEKKELDKIVAQFNIQTDNPVCILHQDIARNFLNSSDPKNKYKFYLKASRFDDISKLYTESSIRVLAIKDIINTKFQVVEESFNDVIQMKKKLKTLEEAKEKEKHKEKLENELIWAKVHESNLELKGLQKKKDGEMFAKKNAEKKLKEVEEGDLQEKLKDLEAKIGQMNDLVRDARERLGPAKDDSSRKREKLSNKARDLTDLRTSIKRTERKYQSCLSEIENLTRNAPEMKLRQEKLKSQITEYENNLISIIAAENSFKHDRQQLQDTIENVDKNLKNIAQRQNELGREKSKKEEQIKQIKRHSSSITVYGEVMMRIVEEVNKAASQGKFEKKPIGPIGVHMKVRDQSWAAAVESFLGKGTLSSFCVDNTRDSQVLSTIMKNVCMRHSSSQPPIICSRFLPNKHNIAPNETLTNRYTNLARALDIDNPVVFNCLIDQQEPERVLLIPTNEEAYQLLDEQHKVPRNCKRAFTKTGDQFYPAPNYKSYSTLSAVTHATLLQADQQNIIRQLQSEIQSLFQNINDSEGDKKGIQQQMQDTQKTLKKNEIELENLRRQRRGTEQKIGELKASIEPEGQTNVGFLEEESRILKTQLETETEAYKKLKRECEQLKTEAEEAKQVYDELQNNLDQSDQEKAPIQGEIQRLKSTIQQASTKSDIIKKQIKSLENKLDKLDTEIVELTEQLNENSENASQICAPIPTQRTTEDINRELKKVVMYLKRIEEENGGSLDVMERFSERQANFNAVNNDLDNLRELLKKTKNALKQRKGREYKLQHMLANSAKHNFQIFLNERNFDGKLEFDMDAKTLEIKVKPIHAKEDPKLKRLDTSSLSGGEKSFSTVCFIMALWQEVQLPFHFLDEFDVFMDGVNRRTVMDLLINYAKSIRQQFVFLTPLDTSSIDISDIITVHRLEAPRQ